jgi:hypothetical protein
MTSLIQVTATIQKDRIVNFEKKEVLDGIEKETGLTEPDMEEKMRRT